jgi:hypothetical protein
MEWSDSSGEWVDLDSNNQIVDQTPKDVTRRVGMNKMSFPDSW